MGILMSIKTKSTSGLLIQISTASCPFIALIILNKEGPKNNISNNKHKELVNKHKTLLTNLLISLIKKDNKIISLEILKKCKKSIDINYKDKDGNTALIIAITKNQIDIAIEILKEYKESISINIKDNDGRTALMISIENEFRDITFEILKNKDVDIKCIENITHIGTYLCKFVLDYENTNNSYILMQMESVF